MSCVFGAIAAFFAMMAFFKLLHLEAELSEHRDELRKIKDDLQALAHRHENLTVEIAKALRLPPR